MGKMTKTDLQLTVFDIQKLKSIVGQGFASPYQITTYPGSFLGMTGEVMDPSETIAANGEFSVPEPVAPISWARRALSALGLKRS
jgi:hypothetical protein